MFKIDSFSRKHIYVIWVIICVSIYLIASWFYPKSMFYSLSLDGFSVGIDYVENYPFKWHPLLLVHWARYIVVYPFWWLAKSDYLLVFQHIVLLLYLIPLLTLKVNKPAKYLRFAILLLPFFMSFRTVLVIVSITLLFFYITCRANKGPALILSALLANLSSGVVLAWLILVGFYFRKIRVERKFVVVCVVFLASGLAFSIAHKLHFFSELAIQAPELAIQAPWLIEKFNAICGNNFICEAFGRNTVFISYSEGRLDRVIVYVGLLFLLSFTWVFSFLKKMPVHKFFMLALPGFFFEGLWVMSFSLVLLIFWGSIALSRYITINE